MFEIIYRYDPSQPLATNRPATAGEAQDWLETGNDAFAHLSAQDLEDNAPRSWLLPSIRATWAWVAAGRRWRRSRSPRCWDAPMPACRWRPSSSAA